MNNSQQLASYNSGPLLINLIFKACAIILAFP